MFGERKPYIVAELNSSHRGKLDNAIEMIDAAKSCGCDAVKFQSWSAESLYCKNYYEDNPIAKRMVNGFSLAPEQLKKLSQYCRQQRIDFSSTPYSNDEVDFLVDECDAKFIKIASMDINNLQFLKYIARKKRPIVLSTGMADAEEIDRAIKTIVDEGNNDICVLHCVSMYPVKCDDVNLLNMVELKNRFPGYDVGYSDHTVGYSVACAAVALGASLVEKHFTLDNSVVGWDNQMATEPKEMGKLVNCCREVALSLGCSSRQVSEDELKQREKMRRSIVAMRDLKAGTILTADDLTAKRPGTGISVSDLHCVIGRRLKKSVSVDEMLQYSYLE